MNKKNLLVVIACMVLAITNALNVVARGVENAGTSQKSTLPIVEVTEATDGIYNFKNFTVEALNTGAYHTEFWLLPTKFANNSYSKFMVYVNGDFIGIINPTKGNWQAARIKENETLNLAKGTNVITIATLAPEFPEVETIIVATNSTDATLSSEAYEEFLNNATAGITFEVPEEDGIAMVADNSTGSGLAHFSNVPLNYTFYKNFSFTQGQDIFITSSSSDSHKIDVIYYGSDLEIVYKPIFNNQPISNSAHAIPDTVLTFGKYQYPYTPATSEEMQGLSWVFPSQKALNSPIQMATAKLTIPKTGKYLVRVRHAVSGCSAVADVNVNGAYYYENIPITLSYMDCQIPANGNVYATMTCCNNFGIDNPYLFIHGAKSDRIVGFNDDGPDEKIKQFNLSKQDSYISQKYFIKTSGISVSNYSSSNPISRCNIIARVLEDSAESVAKVRAETSNNTTEIPTHSILDESILIIGPENINGNIIISAKEKIQRVSLYELDGNRIGSINVEGSTANIPASALNMTQSGIYVVIVETGNGTNYKKVAVK